MASLHLHRVKAVVVGFLGLGRAALARLPLGRQPAANAAPLRFALPLGPRAVDDLLFFVDANNDVAHHLIDHAEAAIELFDQITAAGEPLQHVDALFEVGDLVGELAAAPV